MPSHALNDPFGLNSSTSDPFGIFGVEPKERKIPGTVELAKGAGFPLPFLAPLWPGPEATRQAALAKGVPGAGRGGAGGDYGDQNLGKMLSEYWNTINPQSVISGAIQSVLHPAKMTQEAQAGYYQAGESALQAIKKGDAGESLRHLRNMALPLGLGPQLEQIEGDINSGDWATGMGKAAGMVTLLLAPKALSEFRGSIPIKKAWTPAAAEVAAAVEQEIGAGVRVPAGTATGSKRVQAIQKLAETTGGSGIAKEELTKLTTSQKERLSGLIERTYPDVQTPLTAGEQIQAELKATAVQRGNALIQRGSSGAVSPRRAAETVQQQLNGIIDRLNLEAQNQYSSYHKIRRAPSSLREIPQPATAKLQLSKGMKFGTASVGEIYPAQGGVPVSQIVRKEGAKKAVVAGESLPGGASGMKITAGGKAGEAMAGEKLAMPVHVGPIRRDAQIVELYNAINKIMPAAGENVPHYWRAIRTLMNGPDYIPALDADLLNMSLKSMTRRAEAANLRNMDLGQVANLQFRLEQLIDQGVGAVSPPALKLLKKGRATVWQKWQVADNLMALRDEPVQAFQQMTRSRDLAIQQLEGIQKHAADALPDVRRAFDQYLMDLVENEQAAQAMRSWRNLGSDAKKILYRDVKAIADRDVYFGEVAEAMESLRHEPVQFFNQITQSGDAGLNKLRRIIKYAPDTGHKAGRAFLQNEFDVATVEGGFQQGGKLATMYEKLGPETKRILFGDPQYIKELDRFHIVMRKISEEVNPSQTAIIGHVREAYMTPVRRAMFEVLAGAATGHAPIGMGVAAADIAATTIYGIGTAKLTQFLYSPQGVRLLNRAMAIPVGGSNQAKAVLAAAMLDYAGKLEEEEKRQKNIKPEVVGK